MLPSDLKILYSIPPFLTLCCFLGLAVLTLFHGPRSKEKILFSLISVLGCFLYTDILFAFNLDSKTAALRISRIDHAFIVYLLPLYVHFFHVYLNIPGRKWLIGSAYSVAFLLMCLTPTSWYLQDMGSHYFGYFARGGILYPVFGLGSLLVTIYAFFLIVRTITEEKSRVRKKSLKYVLGGFGLMGVMNGLNLLPNLGFSVYPPGNFSFIPLIVFYVGLFRQNILDMGFLIRKGLVYSVLTVLITGCYAFLVTMANLGFSETFVTETAYFHVLFFLVIVLVFGPLHHWTRKLIDHLFYKDKYNYQKTIQRVSRLIAGVQNIDDIVNRVIETLHNALNTTNCAVFLSSHPTGTFTQYASKGNYSNTPETELVTADSALVRFMTDHFHPVSQSNFNKYIMSSDHQKIAMDMVSLGASVVLPLSFEGVLTGFITVGEKRSGDMYTKEDLDLLETLANQTSLAVKTTKSIQKITSLKENLEITVERRTQALQNVLAEKEKTQERLIRTESLAAIGQLVAGTAHELNNPLTSVTSLIQSVIEDLENQGSHNLPVEDLLDDLTFAAKELARAKAIIASLLGLSRQTDNLAEDVNLNLVVEDALRVLYNRHKHTSIDIVQELAPNLPTIRGNFANLGQVAINIIKNAIDALETGTGRVCLTTEYDYTTDEVVLRCKDNGPGVPKEMRKNIFNPFFTTKTVGKGTGLGLYICHEIVQRHGGFIHLRDQRENGAEFIIRLPAETGNSPKPKATT